MRALFFLIAIAHFVYVFMFCFVRVVANAISAQHTRTHTHIHVRFLFIAPQGSAYLYLHGADGVPRDQALFILSYDRVYMLFIY